MPRPRGRRRPTVPRAPRLLLRPLAARAAPPCASAPASPARPASAVALGSSARLSGCGCAAPSLFRPPSRYLAAERPGSGIERSELRTERRRRRESGFGGLWAMGGARGVARESGFDGLWTMGGPRKVARESRRRRREGREEREAGASL
eukprot:scaffold195736_cov27-Tisochrysis_lutea.AAC.10